MKTTMKIIAAWMLALLLVLQIVPVFADEAVLEAKDSVYRDRLVILTDSNLVLAGETRQLDATEGYTLKWSSDDTDVATVDKEGLVTGLKAGTVKITATEEEDGKVYSDSINLTVVEPEDKGHQGEKMVIMISAPRETITYDGEEHTSRFFAESSDDGFDPDLVQINPDKLVTRTDCGFYPVKYDASDFTYNGMSAGPELQFVIGDAGLMQIRPAVVTVKANDAVIDDEDPDPEFTATIFSVVDGTPVQGLPDGKDESLISYTFTTMEENGITYVVPECEEIQGNYRITTQKGKLTVKFKEYELYNIASINGKFYRLAKTTIRAEKDLDEYLKGVSKGNQKHLKAEEYRAEDFAFEDLPIVIGGIEYVYRPSNFKEDKNNPVQYYTVKFDHVGAVKEKIGGSAGWFLAEGQTQYDDPNETSGFHRDYIITLHKMEVPKDLTEVQPLYNMLCVDGSKNFYRLNRSEIKAKPAGQYSNNRTMKESEYTLIPDEQYDFTNTVLTIDGEEYHYSPVELTGEHEAYYTVSFDRISAQQKINKNDEWYGNDAGWLDDSKAEYGNLPNETFAFHADYNATTHKSTIKQSTDDGPLEVYIVSSWPEDKPTYIGKEITLTAVVSGNEDTDYTLQWWYSIDLQSWTKEPGATGETFTYVLDETNAEYTWKVVVSKVE